MFISLNCIGNMNETKDKNGIAGRIFNARTKEPQDEIIQLKTLLLLLITGILSLLIL